MKFPSFFRRAVSALGLVVLAGLAANATSAVTVPGKPTIGLATAGNASASIAFTYSGAAISRYTASCINGSTTKTGTGTQSPITVSTLTNGLTYVCSVKATNSTGTGAASSTVSVTPTLPPNAPTLNTLAAGGGQITVTFTRSNTGATATSFTATCTRSGVPNTASGTSSPLVVTGLTAVTAYSCTVTAKNTAGSATSTAKSATTAAVTYTTPANFTDVIARSYTPSTTLTATSIVTNRARYMISDKSTAGTSSNYLSIGETYNASTGYAVTSGTLSSASKYNDYLTKTIQMVQASDGYYRLDSHLHPNNSIDIDSTDSYKLKFRNNFGKAATTYGYVTFSYDASTHLLQAQKRYTYSYNARTYAATYTPASTYTNQYVRYSAGAYSLSTTGTPFYLYATPLALGIPEFMNPMKVDFVVNGAAPFITKVTVASTEGTSGTIYKQVNSTYRSQVATAGSNATTKTAADTLLSTIKSTVEASGEKLRYPTAVYTAYRDAALATKLVSDSIADGAPGQNLVPYVYFTNEYATVDGQKVYHPFMVVVSYGNQASPNGLKDVPHPPGSGGTNYVSATVTRYSNLENYIFMIPMKDYGQVTDVTTNSYPSNGSASSSPKNLWEDMSPGTSLSKNVYTWADSADNGILINGAVIFPTFNNVLVPSHLAGELSASGCHVGQGGGGPHCHADGYQSGQGLGFYNDPDYLGKTHPPLLGFGYDGIALFGIYRSSDTGMSGYSTALDGFGGHNHDAIGYHYHAHTVVNYQPVNLNANHKSNLHVLMKGAYIGNTNLIPFFRTNSSFKDNKYLGGK